MSSTTDSIATERGVTAASSVPAIRRLDRTNSGFRSLGDFCAGPNHVLPRMRTARFSSALGAYDFQKRSTLIEVAAAGASTLGPIAATLARSEGLHAHARSAEMRFGCKAPPSSNAELANVANAETRGPDCGSP